MQPPTTDSTFLYVSEGLGPSIPSTTPYKNFYEIFIHKAIPYLSLFHDSQLELKK